MEELISQFSIGLFVYQTVIFVALLFLLRKFAWKPILKAVNEREEKIQGALDAAEKAKMEMAKLKSQNEEMRQAALIERDTLLKEAREVKERLILEAKKAANAESDRIMASAREEIRNEKLAAISEIKTQVAMLSVEIAEKIVKEKLSSDDKQKALVDGLIGEVTLN
jgi:F-type H+-transporting ATPase subunit b